MYSRIAGTGAYLPEKIVTNFDLEKTMDTTDEWIRTRTGIERRHIAADGQTTVDMAEVAARRAIEAAGVTPAEIDFIVFGTTTPDLVFPNCGTLLQVASARVAVPRFLSRPRAAASSTRSRSPTNSSRRAKPSARW